MVRARVDAAFRYAKAHNPAYADKQEVTHQLGESFAAMLERIAAAKAQQRNAPLSIAPIEGESARVVDASTAPDIA